VSALAVLGGSGLYAVDDLEGVEEMRVETPFGEPSDAVIRGRLKETGTTMLFLPRHGRGHVRSPSDINYRANICALKMLGATHVISVSAVGSMKEEILPGDLVVVDQFIDLTKRRVSTFFDAGSQPRLVLRILFAPSWRRSTRPRSGRAPGIAAARTLAYRGPQFSTRAESLLYRKLGRVGHRMTNMPEAKLAREAEPSCRDARAVDGLRLLARNGGGDGRAVIATLKRTKHATASRGGAREEPPTCRRASRAARLGAP
jgi:5'-methylthioadenosine phosphorylase